MLEHELAHLQRHDHYVNCFQSWLRVLLFFHPLVRYACHKLRLERELACDERVLSSGLVPAAYAESKLHDVLLAFAVARLWPDARSNALEPGWVPTRMGGPGAPDDIDQAHRTQAWLATGDDAAARTTAGYFYHLKPREPNQEARDVALQDRLLEICREISGVDLRA